MKRYLFFLFAVVLAAYGGQRAVAQSEADASVGVMPNDSLSMVEEENKLLEKLLPDLCSRKFPTAEEMKMWHLIIEEDKDRNELPVLARALVRAYFGNQFLGLDGDSELIADSSALVPAYGDFYATGDLDWYGLWPDSVYASSVSHNEGKKYDVREIVGGGVYKPWCSAVGKAEGTSVTCVFKLGKRPIDGISVVNGYCHTESQWKNHGRVAKMQLMVDGQPNKIFDLEDTPYTQSLFVDSISPKKSGEPVELTFKILKVYPGAKYNDVSISLLTFCSEQGADAEDEILDDSEK